MAVKCPECGAGADPTPNGLYAHCASCNTVFEPGKDGSSEKGSAHPDNDKTSDKQKTEGEVKEQPKTDK